MWARRSFRVTNVRRHHKCQTCPSCLKKTILKLLSASKQTTKAAINNQIREGRNVIPFRPASRLFKRITKLRDLIKPINAFVLD